MSKVLILIGILCMFAGCGWRDGYNMHCVDGVVYMASANGVTVKWTSEGRIETCK